METISAACAMEWSIELEKALRSKNPGRAVEAILLTGRRLEQWNQEPEANHTMCSIFGLLPREDRLFANTILLRLADAFVYGDQNIRRSIVKVFFSCTRHCTGKKVMRGAKGILSKSRVQNHVELLRKVKLVYDSGDVESRVLCLVLFGCWADFAKDSADIRYLIMSSIVSSHILEVKASLFAAGCFCELAEDFANVVLKVLANMVASSETLTAIRLAGARVFVKMSCSFLVAKRAYKTGMKLVLGASEENFICAMLVSLSKLASQSTILISEQVDLLFSCLNQAKSLQLQTIALRCLYFIFVRKECHLPVTQYMVKALIVIMDRPELPSSMQIGAIKILHKVLLCTLFNVSSFEMNEFSQLLTVLEITSRSSVLAKSLVALHILADLSTKQRAKTETESVGVFSLPSPSWVILLIVERITSLGKSLFDSGPVDPKAFHAAKCLLNLLLMLVRKHPESVVMILDKFGSFIEYLMKLVEGVTPDRQALACEIADPEGDKRKCISSKMYASVKSFFVAYFQYMYEARAVIGEVHEKLELLNEHIQHCDPVDHSTLAIYSILMHSRILSRCTVNRNKSLCNLDGNSDVSLPDILVECKILMLQYAERMLTKMDNWSVYRAGIYAANHGEWLVAAFMFEQLSAKVQSDTYSCWLKLLVLFSHSEQNIQLLFLPKEQSNLVNWSVMEHLLLNLSKEVDSAAANGQKPDWSKVLLGAERSLCSLGEIIGAMKISGIALCFQRWFLALRAKVLGATGEIFKVLERLKQDNFCKISQVDVSLSTHDNVIQKIIQLSLQVNRLAQEFDLVSTSFIGMDCQSSKIIAALALHCSVLAFAAGFPLLIPNILDQETLAIFVQESSQHKGLSNVLLQDLAKRLSHIDSETSANLCLLFDSIGCPKKCCHLQSNNRRLVGHCEIQDILCVARFTVSGILSLHNKINRMHDEEIMSHNISKGFQFLFDILMKWIQIPIRVPKYFFRIRPCFGSELYASGANSRDPHKVTTLPGGHLCLNLCLQLRNVPPGFPLRHTKLYCLIHSRVSFQQQSQWEQNEERGRECRPWECDEMVEMNEKLFRYVTERTKETCSERSSGYDHDVQAVSAFICFDDLNAKGQGFSNCLLDVSKLPPGSYRIKWYSSCVDDLGSYWTILSLNSGPIFTVEQSFVS